MTNETTILLSHIIYLGIISREFLSVQGLGKLETLDVKSQKIKLLLLFFFALLNEADSLLEFR